MAILRRAEARETDTLWALRTAAIRETCSGHYDAASIAAWSSAPMPESFAAVVTSPSFVVAELAREVVGYGLIDLEVAEIVAVFVRPDMGRRGIGAQLLAALESQAQAARLPRLRLSASLNAVAFYERYGYHARERTVFRHPLGFELPCVTMEKALGPSSPAATR